MNDAEEPPKDPQKAIEDFIKDVLTKRPKRPMTEKAKDVQEVLKEKPVAETDDVEIREIGALDMMESEFFYKLSPEDQKALIADGAHDLRCISTAIALCLTAFQYIQEGLKDASPDNFSPKAQADLRLASKLAERAMEKVHECKIVGIAADTISTAPGLSEEDTIKNIIKKVSEADTPTPDED